MWTHLDCYPCLLRHALEASRLAGANPESQEMLVRRVLRRLADAQTPHTPVRLTAEIHALIRSVLGAADPYDQVKRQANRSALEMLPDLRRRLSSSPDRLQTAARMAIAGNIIDHGALGEDYDLAATLERCLAEPIEVDDFASFRTRLRGARRLVYVGDNCGEIVFDRLFIEEIRRAAPAVEIVFLVRGGPVLNDATLADADAVGLAEMVRVLPAGEDAPGCELERSSTEVRVLFESADLIIAKGQGNWEALSHTPFPVYYFLKIKCPVIAEDIGARKGGSVLLERPGAEGRK